MFVPRIQFLRERLRSQGLAPFLRTRLLNLKLLLLRGRFGFHSNLVFNTFADEPYKAKLVLLIATLQPETVVEIGCGLGDVITRVVAKTRIGFDQDSNAVAAANHLNGKRAQFFAGSFLEPADILTTLSRCGVRAIEVLVLTNWIHKVPTTEILRSLATIHARMPIRYLILETINPEFTGCDYQLSTDDLQRFGAVVHGIPGDEIRSFHIVTFASFESNQLLRLKSAVGSGVGYPTAQS